MKLLPFPEEPMFLCYHNKAFPFGVIQANSSVDITKWACTKCVNCNFFSERPYNKFNIAVYDAWGEEEQLVSHRTLYLPKESYQLSDRDLLQILRSSIDNNCYISGIYNERYIPSKRTYGHKDYTHDFLIIGYDNDIFVSVGYVANGKFEQFNIPNHNLISALRTTSDTIIQMNLFSYNFGAIPIPCVERMVEDLQKYISTADYFYNPFSKVNVFGIATGVRLKMFFADEIRQGKSSIDRRYSLAFFEHKRVMSQLVDLFLDDEEKKQYQESANENLARARLVHMLGLKMDYSGNTTLINRIIQLMNEIILQEIEYIPFLIELLQKKYSID